MKTRSRPRLPWLLSLLLLAASGASALVGCAHPPAARPAIPGHFVEAASVTPHGVATIKRELHRAGIVAYTDGSQYPLPYRVLVAPEDRERAARLVAEIKQRPTSVGY